MKNFLEEYSKIMEKIRQNKTDIYIVSIEEKSTGSRSVIEIPPSVLLHYEKIYSLIHKLFYAVSTEYKKELKKINKQ